MRVGVSIDRHTATVTTLVAQAHPTVAETRHLHAESTSDLLTQVATAIPTTAQVRVVLCDPAVRNVTISSPVEGSIDETVRAAHPDVPPNTYTAAVPDTAGWAARPAFVAPRDLVDAVRTAFRQHPQPEVSVPAASPSPGEQGVRLSIRYAHCELVGVSDGTPTWVHRLAAPGLSSLLGHLEGDQRRLHEALGGRSGDPLARSLASAWAQGLAREVSRTLEEHPTDLFRDQSTILLEGVAADAAGVLTALAAEEITCVSHPLAALPGAHPLAAADSFRAAAAVGTDPALVFAAAHPGDSRRSSVALRRRATTAGKALVVLTLLLGPGVASAAALHAHTAALEDTLAAVHDDPQRWRDTTASALHQWAHAHTGDPQELRAIVQLSQRSTPPVSMRALGDGRWRVELESADAAAVFASQAERSGVLVEDLTDAVALVRAQPTP